MQSIYCTVPITELRIDCLCVTCTASFFSCSSYLFTTDRLFSFECASGSAWDGIVVMLLYVCTAIVVCGRIGSVGEDGHVEIVEIP